jgi:hypothetical protein
VSNAAPKGTWLDLLSTYTAMKAAGKGTLGVDVNKLDQMTAEEKQEFCIKVAEDIVKSWGRNPQ